MADEQDRFGIPAFAKWLERAFGRVNSDIFWDHYDRLEQRLGRSSRLTDTLARVAELRLESPIEGMFALEWFVEMGQRSELDDLLLLEAHRSERIDGRLYRLDFMVFPNIWPFEDLGREVFEKGSVIVVEMDGHDFHERTKEQVRQRNEKDRAVQLLGYAVMHFSGSEIVGGAERCVAAVLETADRRGLLRVARDAAARRKAQS